MPKKFASSFSITPLTRFTVSCSSGIRPLHHVGDDRHELVQKRLAHAHLVPIEHGPPQQPLDDVLLLVRARIHILVHGERAGPHVIGDSPQPPAVVRFVLVLAGHKLPPPPARSAADAIDVVVRRHALQRRRTRAPGPCPCRCSSTAAAADYPADRPTRLNCVNTRFQISTACSLSG